MWRISQTQLPSSMWRSCVTGRAQCKTSPVSIETRCVGKLFIYAVLNQSIGRVQATIKCPPACVEEPVVINNVPGIGEPRRAGIQCTANRRWVRLRRHLIVDSFVSNRRTSTRRRQTRPRSFACSLYCCLRRRRRRRRLDRPRRVSWCRPPPRRIVPALSWNVVRVWAEHRDLMYRITSATAWVRTECKAWISK